MLKKNKLLRSCNSALDHIISLIKGKVFSIYIRIFKFVNKFWAPFTNLLEFITKNWVVFALVGSYFGLLYFNIDPAYYFHHIGFEQQQEKNGTRRHS